MNKALTTIGVFIGLCVVAFGPACTGFYYGWITRGSFPDAPAVEALPQSMPAPASGASINVPCRVDRWVDADTCVASVTITADVRLLGVYSPELSTSEGKAARDFVVKEFGMDENYLLEIPLGDKLGRSFTFGRVLGRLYTADGVSVSERIIEAGHGTRGK